MGHRIFRVLPNEYQSNHISHANSPQLKLFYTKCRCLLPCLLWRHIVAGHSSSWRWQSFDWPPLRLELCWTWQFRSSSSALSTILSSLDWFLLSNICCKFWWSLLVISRQFPSVTLLSISLEKMKILDWKRREKPLFQYCYHSLIMKQWLL